MLDEARNLGSERDCGEEATSFSLADTEALELLKKSEARYRALVESSFDAILVLDKGRRIVSCNRAFLSMFQYNREEIEGKSIRVIHPSDGSYDCFGDLAYRIIEKEDVFRAEWSFMRKNGTTIPVETVTSVIKEEDGSRIGYVAIIRDITERKRNEENIAMERQKFELLSENAPFPLIMADKKGTYIFVNRAFTDLFGYTLKDVRRGKAWLEKVHRSPACREEPLAQWSSGAGDLKSGEGIPRTQGITCKDGTEKIVTIASVKLENGGFLETWEDVTERVRAEEQLRMTNEELHALVMASPLAILCLDAEARVRIWNQAAERMFGWTAPEVLGGPYPLVPQGEEREFFLALERGMAGESLSGLELRKQAKNGVILDISIWTAPVYDHWGAIVGIMGVLADITEHKRTEALLKESEAKYRSIIEESLLVGAYIAQDGVFKYVNKRFCEIHGYSYDELVDRLSPLDLAHPDDRSLVEQNMRKGLAQEAEQAEYEFRAVRKDNEVITVKVIGGSLNYQGRVALVGTLLDFTREKALEQQLLQAQKMEAIGTLAGGVAHDFNNILTAIIGYGNLLQMKMEKDDPLRVYASHILASSQTAVQLTHSLLAFSRKQVIALRPQKVNRVIKGVERLLTRLLTEDIEITIKPCPEDPVILADVTQMDQVLMNLATNARDAMPRGGRLTIEVKVTDIDKQFLRAHGFGVQGRYALVSVTDTGKGMDELTKKKIFDPFFTTKGLGRGTGLGLAIVYGIVKQHNGYINVESVADVGTAFHIYLPVAKTQLDEKEIAAQVVRGGKETILIAEDKTEVRKLTKEVLEDSGYTVIEAADGEEALAAFQKSEGEIRLALLDVVMPRMNGREAAEAIGHLNPGMKIIFMSGYTADILADKGVNSSIARDFIAKPASPNELLAKVREVLDR